MIKERKVNGTHKNIIAIKISENNKLLGKIFVVNSVYLDNKIIHFALKGADAKAKFSNEIYIFDIFEDAASALLSIKHGEPE